MPLTHPFPTGWGGKSFQYNIRIESELLRRYREYCDRNGLDPNAQVIAFMRRVVETEVNLQERLWAALTKE